MVASTRYRRLPVQKLSHLILCRRTGNTPFIYAQLVSMPLAYTQHLLLPTRKTCMSVMWVAGGRRKPSSHMWSQGTRIRRETVSWQHSYSGKRSIFNPKCDIRRTGTNDGNRPFVRDFETSEKKTSAAPRLVAGVVLALRSFARVLRSTALHAELKRIF